MPNAATTKRLQAIPWLYAPFDPESVRIIESRLADAGRRNAPITYSEVVQGIEFTLDDGRRHIIDTHNWTGLDQRIIGQFLGFISARTYGAHEFMASALAVAATNGQPSRNFYDFALNIGA